MERSSARHGALAATTDTQMTYGIIGLGLIGTSVGMAISQADPLATVRGYDCSRDAMVCAAERGAVKVVCDTASEAVRGTDLVILAVPQPEYHATLDAIVPTLPETAVVTDVASCKRDIVEICENAIGSRFVGGHPVAGSERRGAEAASLGLFIGAPWVVTPTATTEDKAVQTVLQLVRMLGARPVILSPCEHDRIMAYVSHLPHVLAFVLASVALDSVGPLGPRCAGGSFRDATRVARSEPEFWADILLRNADFLAEATLALGDRLNEVSAAIRARDRSQLLQILRRGHLPVSQRQS